MSVYVDYAATTPMDKEILQRVMDTSDQFGNPSSIHQSGKSAKSALESNRREIARAMGATPDEVVITSGATEANNLAIRGIVANHDHPHVITTEIEHSSVLNTYEALEAEGLIDVTYLPADEDGLISTADLKDALRDDTVLVSIILVNNETGAVQPIYDIEEVLTKSDAYLHLDAVQAVGHMGVDVVDLNADLLSLSGHKIYGPKGIGALYVRSGIHLKAMMTGGSHEKERRAGTENTMWIQALALALKKSTEEMNDRMVKEARLKESFLNALTERSVPFEMNGNPNYQSGHIVNLYFPWTESEFLLTALDMAGVHASGGSACTAGTVQPSHVILSMYDDTDRASHSIRFSFSHLMSEQDVKRAAAALEEIYTGLYESKMI